MAGNWTLHIEQGATFDTTLTWKNAAGTPVDLTGFTARAQGGRLARAAGVRARHADRHLTSLPG